MSTSTATRPRPTVPMTAAQQADLERRHAETQRRVRHELVRNEAIRFAWITSQNSNTRLKTADVLARAEEARFHAINAQHRETQLRIARDVALAQLDRVNDLARASGRAIDVKQFGVAGHAPSVELKTFPFVFKNLGGAEPGAAPRFAGYGAIFSNIDSALEIIAPGAFAEDLGDFIENGFIGGINHDWNCPIARVKSAHEDARGLYVESDDIIDTAHGSDVAKLLRARVIKKLSIGYRVLRDEWLETVEKVEDYWRSHSYTPSDLDRDRLKQSMKQSRFIWDAAAGEERKVKGIRLLRRVKLMEVSAVAVPANDRASVMVVKHRTA